MTMLRRRNVVVLLAGAATGCAAPPPLDDRVRMAPGVFLRLPAAAALGRSVESAQLVRAEYGGERFVFEAHLSVTPQRLLMACVDLLGREALSLRWEGRILSAKTAPWLPDAIRPDNMLADLMLIAWPTDSLRVGLASSDAVLSEGPGWRSVSVAGSEMIRAEYASASPWNGAVTYRNLAWGYELDVQAVELGR
jgi:hypothetical protein